MPPVVKPHTVYCYNHQRKGLAYLRALVDNGFHTAMSGNAHVLLSDSDMDLRIKKHLHNLKRGRVRLFLYPHAARPSVMWDGFFEPSNYTTANFVPTEGQIEVIRAYGYKKPIHPVGWALCGLREFHPNDNPRKVLFAPIHPTKRGWLSPKDQSINRAAFERLLKLVQNGGIELTVRYIRGLENNGIWNDLRVNYVQGDVDLSVNDIDNADLVVSHQTFAYLAVARGVPTVMMAEDVPPRNGGSETDFRYAESWDKYKDLLMYPLDILAEDDTMGLLRRASKSDSEIFDWKSRMIGDKPFDPILMSQIVKSYL